MSKESAIFTQVSKGEDFITTNSGVKFYPTAPLPEDIRIEDIAHALAHICRFGGHSWRFYSVAEHSVRVSRLVHHDNALAALLHDASEAYLGDMIRPLKWQFPAYGIMEAEIQTAIYHKFGITGIDEEDIKRADNIMLATEGRDLMPNTHDWILPEGPLEETSSLPFQPHIAQEMFMNRFSALVGGNYSVLEEACR